MSGHARGPSNRLRSLPRWLQHAKEPAAPSGNFSRTKQLSTEAKWISEALPGIGRDAEMKALVGHFLFWSLLVGQESMARTLSEVSSKRTTGKTLLSKL